MKHTFLAFAISLTLWNCGGDSFNFEEETTTLSQAQSNRALEEFRYAIVVSIPDAENSSDFPQAGHFEINDLIALGSFTANSYPSIEHKFDISFDRLLFLSDGLASDTLLFQPKTVKSFGKGLIEFDQTQNTVTYIGNTKIKGSLQIFESDGETEKGICNVDLEASIEGSATIGDQFQGSFSVEGTLCGNEVSDSQTGRNL